MASGGEREKLTRYRLLVTRYFQLKGVFMSRIRFSVSVVFGFVFSFVASHISAQQISPPEVEWINILNPSVANQLRSIVQTPDGGYITAGLVLIKDPEGISINLIPAATLIKLSGFGDTEWTQTYLIEKMSKGYSNCLASDGGYILLGSANNNKPESCCRDLFILKTDSRGIPVWHNILIYNGFLEYIGGPSIIQLRNSDYVIAANNVNSLYSSFLMRITTNGDLIWKTTIGGLHGAAYSVMQTADNGLISVGRYWDEGDNGYITKVNLDGDIEWQNFKPLDACDNLLCSVAQTSDANFIVTGGNWTYSDKSMFVSKLDTHGDLLWITKLQNIDPPYRLYSGGFSVIESKDHNYVASGKVAIKDDSITGYTRTIAYIAKLDQLGNVLWDIPQYYWGVVYTAQAGNIYSLKQTVDGGLIAVGYTVTQIDGNYRGVGVIIKFRPEGLPKPPAQVSAQLRTEQSIGLDWIADNGDGGGAQVANDITYVLEKKTGSSVWQKIGETAVNVYKWIDTPVQPNEDITFRISAKNANGTSATIQSNTIRTPDSRWQLKIYDPDQDRWVDCPKDKAFNPDWGTAVIVHGWQLPGSSSPITGWVKQMAKAINSRLNTIDKESNIITWEWISEATSLLPQTAAVKVDDETQKLKSSLAGIFPRDYMGPVHFMGHSLGSHIVTLTAILLHTAHPAFQNTFPPSQITLWDTPDAGIGIGNLDINCKYLRSRGVYIDSYAGCTNLLSHNAHFRVDVPCIDLVTCGFIPFVTPPGECHSKPHEWYRETVERKILRIKKNSDCLELDWKANIGFNTSILLSANPQNPVDLQRPKLDGCDQEGTLEFSKLSLCSQVVLVGEIFGLDNPLECPTPKFPLQEHTQALTGGYFWTDEFYQCNCSYTNSTEMIIGIGRRGEGGGAQVQQLTARYTLDLLVDSQWDYVLFEYDFTSAPAPTVLESTLMSKNTSYPLFFINSDTVFNEEYLNSGLQDIREFHNQQVTLEIKLTSTQPDTFVKIRNLTYWKDFWHQNHPPIANAGSDQIVIADEINTAQITLDGSGSSDEDGDELDYKWIMEGGIITTGILPTVDMPAGIYQVALVVTDIAENYATDEIIIEVKISYIRGDSNTDSTVDISDAINTLGFLFTGQGVAPCKDASDANDDGTIDISDAVFTLGFLFLGTQAPPAPYPIIGIETTEDILDCREYLR